MHAHIRPHFGDVGYDLIPPPILDEDGEPRDITDAEHVYVLAKRLGSGEQTTFDGEVHDGPNGLVRRRTEEGDLDEDGDWTIQAWAKFDDGSEFHGHVEQIRVNANLEGGTGVSPGGISSHASRHHHDGADPLAIEDLAVGTYADPVFFAGIPEGLGLPHEHPTGVTDSQLASFLTPHFSEALRPTRRGASAFFGNESPANSHYWRVRRNTSAASRTITVSTGPDERTEILYSVEDPGGSITFAQGSGVQLFGDGITIYYGELAWLIYLSETVAIVVPWRRNPRLHVATAITTDYTVQASDHGRMIPVTGDATITVPDTLPVGTEVYFDLQGSHTVTLAGSGSMTLVGGAGDTIAEDGTAGIVVISATRTKRVGELTS